MTNFNNKGGEIVNKWYTVKGTSDTVEKLLHVIIACADDDKDDDSDGYWHP